VCDGLLRLADASSRDTHIFAQRAPDASPTPHVRVARLNATGLGGYRRHGTRPRM